MTIQRDGMRQTDLDADHHIRAFPIQEHAVNPIAIVQARDLAFDEW
ncbi:MAG: hypothetical protein ACYDC8_17470 [Gammaproteobacteria bacterium]